MSPPEDTEQLFHVTVLSNLIRGYDRYARRYDKARIPESSYPDRFFLLRRGELGIGLGKATPLLDRSRAAGHTDDRLIALQTSVPSSELRDNDHPGRAGVGRFVPRGFIELEAVHLVEEDGRLQPVALEEACARSYRMAGAALAPFDSLAPRSVSLLPVARACQARCPFCFSRASVSSEITPTAPDAIDWARVAAVLREARARGAERAVITGGGEPSLIGAEALSRLVALASRELGKVVLISNGAVWGRQQPEERAEALGRLAAAGLSVLALSRHHHDPEVNAVLMGLRTDGEAVARTVHALRGRGASLKLRWVCVLQRGGVHDQASLERYLDWAVAEGVGEICFKELYVSTSVESEYHDREANAWSERHQVPLRLVLDAAQRAGWHQVDALPWGAPVFAGPWRGGQLRVAAYTEPSVIWERTHGLCRSWNLMADGRCLASLEDRASEVMRAGNGNGNGGGAPSTTEDRGEGRARGLRLVS